MIAFGMVYGMEGQTLTTRVTETCFEVLRNTKLNRGGELSDFRFPNGEMRCVYGLFLFHQFGLVDYLGQDASTLARSDLRRLFAAAAFVSDPAVILMDEVFFSRTQRFHGNL